MLGTERASPMTATPPAPSRPRSEPITRWGFFAVALVLGTALLVSSITSYLGARTLLDIVIRGQAEDLHHELQRNLEERPHRGPPRDEQLERFIEDHADEGVRYVAVMGPDDEPIAAAGTTSDPRPLRPGELRVLGDRVQVSFALHPPRGHPLGKGPDDKKGFGPPGPLGVLGGRGPPQPPPLVIEFRPEAALALGARTRRDLAVGVTVAIALMLAAAVFWRLSRRAQAAEVHLGRQRHLAALGEMSAVLAHEIRNPLASLKGHAQLLAERVEDDPALARKVARIVDESQRLETLTHSLLDFARTGRIEPAEVDPAALLRRCAEACAQAACGAKGDAHEGPPKGVTVEVDDAGAPPRWRLDAPKLERVLGNLLDNAAQAAPGAPVQAWVRSDGRRLVFEVRDRGPGVPVDERARIFEPFHTTRTRGTGLGLAVTRRIVEQHGGTIEVLDAPGGGACFRVSLPSDPQPAPSA
jgi:two-component system, NtrC family, sensor histidine kinase HydH